MKRESWLRIVSLMLCAVIISSVYVNHTIARFSDVAQSTDSTRVAIWDINANEVTMDLFNTSYTDENTGNILALSYNGEKIIAPGTSGTSLFSIVNHKGDIAPEVMYYIRIDLDDSNVSNDIITNNNIQWKLDDGSWGTWDDLKVALYSLSGSPSGIKTYQAGEFADAFKKNITHSISWQWLEDDIYNNRMVNEEDYIALLSIKISARQTDTVYTTAVEGSNSVINVNDEIVPLTVKSSANLSGFNDVKVNDEVVDPENYTLTEGSTVVTFKKSYLDTLSLGGYNVEIVSADQTATAKMDIVDRTFKYIIPEGGTYYIGVTNRRLGKYNDYTLKLEAGDKFPVPQTGDIYIYGDYEYRYNMDYEYSEWIKNGYNGWGVRVLDKTKTSYGEILTSISDKNIVNLNWTFYGCDSMETSPILPSTVVYMMGTFEECYSLREAPIIPSGVVDMFDAFFYCESLEEAPVLPNGVKEISYIFYGCSLLDTLPVIPSSVLYMDNAFGDCVNLTGEVEINANPFRYSNVFNGTKKSIKLIGSSSKLNEIAEGCSNVTVKSGSSTPSVPDEPVVHSGKIPVGGTYYQGVTNQWPEVGDYAGATVYTAGQNFPELQTGDVYVYGDYEYRYNMDWMDIWTVNSQGGWSVKVLNSSKYSYGEILSNINNEDVVSLKNTFWYCSNLTESPLIPNTITNMGGTFYGCSKLVSAPTIHSGVTNIGTIFLGCESLTGEVEINANPTNYTYAFMDTKKPIILTGSSILLSKIADTATNSNVSVGN